MNFSRRRYPAFPEFAIVGVAGSLEHADQIRQAKKDASVLGLDLVSILLEGPDDLSAAFRRMKAEGVNGLVVLRSGFLLPMREQIAARALKARLPTMFGHGRGAISGGLMAYGADTKTLFHRAATYVDKILNGANPAELKNLASHQAQTDRELKDCARVGIKFHLPSCCLRTK